MNDFNSLYYLYSGLSYFLTALWAERVMHSDICRSVQAYKELQQVHHATIQQAIHDALCLLAVEENFC